MIDPRPFHIVSYGTLMGVQFYQTFVSGTVAFKSLPRPQFAALQRSTFPIYFSLQSALPILVALTASKNGEPLGVSGLLDSENCCSTLAPLAVTVVAGLVNMFVLRPLTVNTMTERHRQETRDGKKSYDPAPHSKEMVALNKRFARLHGMSSLLNLACLGATIYYGVVLSKRLA
ncbi:hypothetical protein BDV59DRAFT_179226 [Aspergillus ambiguus]|uniref:DUF4149 domain-containing protein n=1 Tax=Aspergillus ambiguus TaxID=176160 RepID=UPI003CCE351C